MKHVFVVDDDREIRMLIRKYLEKEHYQVTEFGDGERVAAEYMRLKPDLLVLDISMPGLDGIALCKTIRKSSEVPIVFVSARGEELDRIIGLEVGADDYMVKPFSPRELMVRIKNLFKRSELASNRQEEPTLAIGELKVNRSTREGTYGGVDLKLTGKELDTLHMLMLNRGMALSRDQLLDQVWGYQQEVEGRIVDDVIKRLRKKLSMAGCPLEVVTVWGFGYKIEKEYQH